MSASPSLDPPCLPGGGVSNKLPRYITVYTFVVKRTWGEGGTWRPDKAYDLCSRNILMDLAVTSWGGDAGLRGENAPGSDDTGAIGLYFLILGPRALETREALGENALQAKKRQKPIQPIQPRYNRLAGAYNRDFQFRKIKCLKFL